MRPVGGGASLRGTMVKVETPLYTAVLASEGGGRIVRWDLKAVSCKKSNGQIGLVAERDELPLTLRIPGIEGPRFRSRSTGRNGHSKKGRSPGSSLPALDKRRARGAPADLPPETYQIDVETTVLGYPSYAVSLGFEHRSHRRS